MGKKSEGITEKTLKELGKMIPGLGSLVAIAKKSTVFNAKLKEKDEEIEGKLKGDSWEEEFHRKGERLRKEKAVGNYKNGILEVKIVK